MDISVYLFFDEESERSDDVDVLRLRRQLRDKSNPLELPNTKFVSFFRLSKEAFCHLLDEIKDHFKQPVRGTAIPPILKLCSALRFFADGSYQQSSGNDFNVGLAQPTVSLALKEVLDAMEQKICPMWIKARMSEEELNASKVAFYRQTGFPGIVGCIDGTHVRIISPQKHLQHLYLNRKGYYSLNVMVMCDNKMNIRYVDARHPGANHDSMVFTVSSLKAYLQRTTSENSWILGDAGYPLLPYLMTPFRVTEPGSQEAQYNTIHAKARNIVERTKGVLKNRFRCLLSARALHYAPSKATQIVNVCCALHNICQHFKVELQEEVADSETGTQNVDNTPVNANVEASDSGIARSIRNRIMQSVTSR